MRFHGGAPNNLCLPGFRIARRPVRKTAYDCASCLNRGHMRWAWASLVMVAFCDLYVRMLSMGIWHDFRIL